MITEPPPSAPSQLTQLLHRYRLPQAILVATQMGLPDLLAQGPRSAAELAHATNSHEPTLHLLLCALTSADVVAEGPDGRFRLTPLSNALRTDTPDSWREWVLSQGEIESRVWGALLHTVQTGQPAFEAVFGSSFYAYMTRHPDLAERWDRAIEQSGRGWFQALPALYDFSTLRTLVDVGGGNGAVLARILQAVPTLQGVLFDLPHVVAGASPIMEAAGVAERCAVVAGDMFTAVPAGYEAYLLARVLWNWDDEHARLILRACRAALAEQGRLLILETVLPDGPRPPIAAFSDLNLLLTFGGQLRSEAEFRVLLSAEGWEVAGLFGQTRLRLIEARPMSRENTPGLDQPSAR